MRYFILLLLCVFFSCETSNSEDKDELIITEIVPPQDSFSKYWSSGGAEISSYELEQVRYGESHEGHAVMVYVKEPFSMSKQVKLDDYISAGDDKVSVLKLNLSKKFLTGIYPYSMMMSTFSPMDGSAIIKSTTSVQEWCGQTYLQLNLGEAGYDYTGFSYFESEGDVEGKIEQVIVEDQLWTLMRINPDSLPLGEFSMLPSNFFLRLRHQPIEAKSVFGKLEILKKSAYFSGAHFKYELSYDGRTLAVYFGKELPHQIFGWEESYRSGFRDVKMMTTKAKLINTIRSKYWGKNANSDRELRKNLRLPIK